MVSTNLVKERICLKLRTPGDSKDPHYSDDSGIYWQKLGVSLFQSYSNNGKSHDHQVQFVPPFADESQEAQRVDFHRRLHYEHRREEVVEDLQGVNHFLQFDWSISVNFSCHDLLICDWIKFEFD